MHSLTSCYLKNENENLTDSVCQKTKRKFFAINISIPPDQIRAFYFESTETYQRWVAALQKVMGYSNVLDFYSFEKALGKGQFGVVRRAKDLKSGQKVAIKQVKKKNMSHVEIFQQRREVEVLKMCQHENIIQLIDLFENSDYYFMVLDYMKGADLFDYL